MKHSTSERIGAILALLEDKLVEDPLNTETLQKIALVTECYRNLAMGGLPNLQNDFDRGYDQVRRGSPELSMFVEEPDPNEVFENREPHLG